MCKKLSLKENKDINKEHSPLTPMWKAEICFASDNTGQFQQVSTENRTLSTRAMADASTASLQLQQV